ncbi:MAG: HIT family protein [Anaerolineae bacterium]|nr:HIT family protein [Anaerolineae bacterium]MCI0608035.1 HIT family protein [Anaerolineae bacterium]
MKSCIFCKIVNGDSPASKVYEDDLCLAFMDIQPVNPGHVLVVPKAHFTDLTDLPAHIGSHLFQVAQRITLSLPNTGVKSEGVDLFLAHGEAAGQDVFHVHLHVIPRYEGDGFGFRFGPNYSNLPERSELDAIATQIKYEMEK